MRDLFDIFPDLPGVPPRAPVSERVQAVRNRAEAIRERIRENIAEKQAQIARNRAAGQKRPRRPTR